MTDPFWIVLGLGLINALTSLLGFTSIAEKVNHHTMAYRIYFIFMV